MYLKSIEVHGFKSFANKIVFRFHDGITTIVGPNGSGKSNVADAVRWVLGEQSAKQLRGSSMQDVIFSGSEARKPLGYAYVAITFDNSDHKLPIEYDEVSVARRVYRSGESEYLINGSNCRLRDVQELFMDTGIGKEGYSIIGQGQIDKILSTKPEDRRELFDEAAGIVKFKKRKALAEKNLEEERLNLSRVNDILSEIENQIGPLERQSEVAKEYLRLRDRLKTLEVNQFLLEYEKSGSQKKIIDEKYGIAEEDYKQTKVSYDNAKDDYDALASKIESYDKELGSCKSGKNDLQLEIERLDGEIRVLREQIASITQNDAHIGERMKAVEADLLKRRDELGQYAAKEQECDENTLAMRDSLAECEAELEKVQTEIVNLDRQNENHNSDIIRLLNENGAIRTDLQRFETMLEQNSIRKTEINQRILTNRSDADESREKCEQQRNQHHEISELLNEVRAAADKLETQIGDCNEKLDALRHEHEVRQRNFLSEQSRLESMRNIAERYDGYGNSIRRIMEKRGQYPGIAGVVADIITVDQKYETAIETALGASIQNIVVDNEGTAKKLIEYLKTNRFGRATFLPLTSVGEGKQSGGSHSGEKGVIGNAASLVSAEDRFRGIVNYLLGRIIVVDNIDNAIALEKKNGYNLRIVTLEGEQLSPGGSMSGGAYRNSSNLLGRKREIEEIEETCQMLGNKLEKLKTENDLLTSEKHQKQQALEEERKKLQGLLVEENAARVSYENEKDRLKSVNEIYAQLQCEQQDNDVQSAQLKERIDAQRTKLRENDETNHSIGKCLTECTQEAELLKARARELAEKNSSLRIEYAGLEQNAGFIKDNVERVKGEISVLLDEKSTISENAGKSRFEKQEKEACIERLQEKRTRYETKIRELEISIDELTVKKENVSREHKGFLEKWQELGNRVNALDKELFRLQGQRDRLAEQIDSQISYIWEEYELTITTAAQFQDETIKNTVSNKRDIGELKSSIKALGDVNVNSIDDYKSMSERKLFLCTQRDDIISSEQKIAGIIQELDVEMRRQFSERFELIREQFNLVFRELFGGGRADLSLTEDEDILEAGIIIIAQPPGKKLQNIMQLSGGEKSLTAISMLFAIQNLKPSPFCLLDEIEAALDDSNVKRFASYLKKLTKNSQFIVITHRRGTMAAADILYGITMQEKGVSTLVSVNLIENDLDE